MVLMKNIMNAILPGLAILLFTGCAIKAPDSPIDREALVKRHMVHATGFDSLNSLSVGNGSFAFTADFTGLQSFPELYRNGIPLGTMSEWGWHSFPNEQNYRHEESYREYDFHGRKLLYDVQWNTPDRNREAANYFRQNPHRLHLGIVGLEFLKDDGTKIMPDEIDDIHSTLDPWTGKIHSTFTIGGVPVEVVTYAHQEMDLISSTIKSALIQKGAIHIVIRFPYPTGNHSDDGCDWDRPSKHASILRNVTGTSAEISRVIDTTAYAVKIQWEGDADIHEGDSHFFNIVPHENQDMFSFSCLFSPSPTQNGLPDFNAVEQNNVLAWKDFWMKGGVVDFSECTDPRAPELERRVILSQYLTKIQCAGNYPPQETGLTYNSWFGKFHLEMHWWHGVHFALWNRCELLEKSLAYYGSISESAWKTAKFQGFDGYRWPKMTDPAGLNSPSGVGSFLIWQQPHLIYMAELCYRNNPDIKTIRKYAGLVFSSADFMASYAWYDGEKNRYVLGPALIPAQERYSPETTINPPFELSYWYTGLLTAQKWKERLGLEPERAWDSVMMLLSPLPQVDGLYLGAESAVDSYTNQRYMTDHPMVLGAFGMLPMTPLMDTVTMRKTFEFVWENWHWDETWGWDFPMVAMSATRLGMPGKAIDALFMDVQTNTYLPNGHNYQDSRLRLYLPGNGGLLTAVAMMCAGYTGSEENNPGFPKNGKWNVKWEGLNKLP